jgi:succinate dehydrogenase flavin-adding protein (antitoxin of CptAB toxin-antitoxin module)
MGKMKEYYFNMIETMSEAEQTEYEEWLDKNAVQYDDEDYLAWVEQRAKEIEDAEMLQNLKDEELIEMIELKKMGA